MTQTGPERCPASFRTFKMTQTGPERCPASFRTFKMTQTGPERCKTAQNGPPGPFKMTQTAQNGNPFWCKKNHFLTQFCAILFVLAHKLTERKWTIFK